MELISDLTHKGRADKSKFVISFRSLPQHCPSLKKTSSAYLAPNLCYTPSFNAASYTKIYKFTHINSA